MNKRLPSSTYLWEPNPAGEGMMPHGKISHESYSCVSEVNQRGSIYLRPQGWWDAYIVEPPVMYRFINGYRTKYEAQLAVEETLTTLALRTIEQRLSLEPEE